MTKDEFNQLKNSDIYSMILFILYLLKDDEKYSTLSELIYVLDKDSLFRLLQFYGGMTITIPTVEDLEVITKALLLYSKKDLKFVDGYDILEKKDNKVLEAYTRIKDILSSYKFKPRNG